MVKFRLFILLAVIGMVSAGGVFSQEKKMRRLEGTLPKDWGKLGLSDDQKQKVYKAQAKYNEKIDKLKAEIKACKRRKRRNSKPC